MSAGRITEEEQLRIHNEFINLLDTNVKKGEKATQELVAKYAKFEKKRNVAIRVTGCSAEQMKALNDAEFGVETGLRVVSLAGKSALFFGPAPALIGASASLTADTIKSSLSRKRMKKWDEIAETVMRALQEDIDATAELYDAMKKNREIALFLTTTIKKFHSGTVKGYFDNVPSLQPFVDACRNIREVQSLKGMLDFLSLVNQRAQALVRDPRFSPSLLELLTYNPDVLSLVLGIPDILCDIGFLVSRGAPSGLAGGLLRGFSVFGIVTDVVGLCNRLRAYDTYPKLAQELLKIKEELEKGKEKVGKLKKEIEKEESDLRKLEKGKEKKEDLNELKKGKEKFCNLKKGNEKKEI